MCRAAGADQSGSRVEINAELWKFSEFANPGSLGGYFHWSERVVIHSLAPHVETGLRGRGGVERGRPRRRIAASLAGNGA